MNWGVEGQEGQEGRGGPVARQLDAQRWHFQHGPIDLIIWAEGLDNAVRLAVTDAWTRFVPLLSELVSELGLLRQPAQGISSATSQNAKGQIAKGQIAKGYTAGLMCSAVFPFHQRYEKFITPMAAVAGAVSQTLIEGFKRPGIQRAAINNGGDIALYLAPGQQMTVGMVQRIESPTMDGVLQIHEASNICGIATSGWGGRSLSLGVADSVTVLAATASQADAAATMIANEIDINDPAIKRKPADQVRDNSDLGQRLVTVEVGTLAPGLVRQALERGYQFAQRLKSDGLIAGAALSCQHQGMVLS
jgi:uncharacterized protein